MPSTQYVVVRTTGDPDALVATLRAIVKGGKPDGRARGRHDHGNAADAEPARPRLYAVLLGGFATVALLIAVIGLFGGLSYAVTQRTREIGVRTALGAAPRDIMGLVVKPGTLMSAVGLTLGLGLAAAPGPYLAGFLFGVKPFDARTFASVGVTLLVATMISCAVPARRAARIDAIKHSEDEPYGTWPRTRVW